MDDVTDSLGPAVWNLTGLDFNAYVCPFHALCPVTKDVVIPRKDPYESIGDLAQSMTLPVFDPSGATYVGAFTIEFDIFNLCEVLNDARNASTENVLFYILTAGGNKLAISGLENKSAMYSAGPHDPAVQNCQHGNIQGENALRNLPLRKPAVQYFRTDCLRTRRGRLGQAVCGKAMETRWVHVRGEVNGTFGISAHNCLGRARDRLPRRNSAPRAATYLSFGHLYTHVCPCRCDLFLSTHSISKL
ncbi:hypothetical protein M427DRAFT_421544 [Gonapodya prolifera JEL478]|uniref:Uncharacterized protein n=1 Tax=Gonapodya prolifera (strain JEL478) TaxID=1344416 RepID=A0A139A4H5_GONPJ|nr:hypothetical protein M427DRAFT_421544 [Gonapodya prolifera JEL478]|eukprot:KXS11727.1 hypothetical protein M427DRAFT_421544 [Gonapodya prolifera JEL478]